MKPVNALLAVFMIATAATATMAQGIDGSGGRRPYGSYFDAGIDSINIYNGNLMLDINLFSLPGRELSTGLRLTYNSQKWQQVDLLGWPSNLYSGGWRVFDPIGERPIYRVEYARCEWNGLWLDDYYNIIANWIDGLGTRHVYSAQVSVQAGSECMSSPYPAADNTFLMPDAADGSQLWTGDATSPAALTFKDGTRITFGATPRITTRNGNYLEQGVSAGNRLPPQDTVLRTIGFVSNQDSGLPQYYKDYTIKDSDGIQRTYRLNYTRTSPVLNPISQQWETRQDRLDSIALPSDPPTFYSFEYAHDQGFLTRVTLPTGAFIAYEYNPSADQHALENDFVTARHVSEDGINIQASWFYARSTNAPQRDTYVQTPAGYQDHHNFNEAGLEYEAHWYEPGVLKKRVTTYRHPGAVAPYMVRTILDEAVQQHRWFEYDSNGSVIRQDDTDWSIMGVVPEPLRRIETPYRYYYDPFPFQRPGSEVVSAWNPSSGQYEVQSAVQFDYDGFSLQATPSDVPNKSTVAGVRGNLTHMTRWDSQGTPLVSTLQYDDVGNVIRTANPMGHATTISYEDNFDDGSRNTFAYPTHITTENQTTHAAYDFNTGLEKRTIDARNLISFFSYDRFNRPTLVRTPVAAGDWVDTNTTYVDANRTMTVTTPVPGAGNQTATIAFDKLYRPVRAVVADPAGNIVTETEYDVEGRVVRASSPHRDGEPIFFTQVVYDILGRQTLQANPDSTTQSTNYSSNETTVTDEAGNIRKYRSDGLGRMVYVEEAPGVVTSYGYHLAGGLRSVNQSGLTRAFEYDQLGRLLWETHPETGTTRYQYDAASRLITRTDARNIVTSYGYDNLARLLNVAYSDGTPPVSYGYDENGDTGFRTSMIDATGTATFDFDEAGRLATETRSFHGVGQSFTTAYTYFKDGKLKTVALPSGRTVEYAYQSGTDQLASVRTNLTGNTNLLGSHQYNAAGQLLSRLLANGITSTLNYNNRNQLLEITAQRSGTPLLNLLYGYGANNGRIRYRIDTLAPEHSVTYSYDDFQRLQSVSAMNGSWSISWGFDIFGNRTSQTPTGLATSKVGSPSFGYVNNRNTSWGYDPTGNVVSADGHYYAYDAENRLWSLDGGAARYQYDGEGRRVKKITPSGTAYYVYGQVGLLSEFTTGAGSTNASAADALTYKLSEQTGTTTLLTRSDGTVLEQNRVLPYGEPWNPTSPGNEQKFTSYQRDAESDLDYAMARFYAARSGRFMSPDPGHVGANIGDPQSWNAYVYGSNDPINRIDPNGSKDYWALCRDGECIPVGPGTNYDFEYLHYLARIQGVQLTVPVGGQEVSSVLCPIDPQETSGMYVCATLTHSRDVPFSIADSIVEGVGAGVLQSAGSAAASLTRPLIRIGIRKASAVAGSITKIGAKIPESVTNPLPKEVVRVIAGSRPFSTLGTKNSRDVFVSAAEDIAGLNPRQIAERLHIPYSDVYTVIRFPTPEGIASPVFRSNPGFLQGGLTKGGAREFVIPNGPIPRGAHIELIGW